MELQRLFELQAALDHRIEKGHQLEGEKLIEKKVLALFVEVGELANETRCFKFWSLKPPSKREVILEEFVDGIHFILSLGLDFGFEEKIQLDMKKNEEQSLTDCFLSIIDYITTFKKEQTLDNYESLFKQYVSLGNLLGFFTDEIMQAYVTKNEVNHERQNQGY